MIVRERAEADLGACEELARLVHESDDYPHYVPGDLRNFVASRGAYTAWVAERGGEIVGHVALHARSTEPVMRIASDALGQPVERLGVISRLLVSPQARGEGAGRVLLETASRHAVAMGLFPVLDVAIGLASAIRLYERCGWVRAGEVTVRFKDGNTLDEFVYLGPVRPGAV